MASAVVVARGPFLFLVPPGPGAAVKFVAGERSFRSLGAAIRALPAETTVAADSESSAAALTNSLGVPVRVAGTPEVRAARGALPGWDPGEERRYVLGTARASLERALRTPEEILITLTREEERVERTVGRESRAAESFLVVEGSPLAEYARRWSEVRDGLARHHEQLAELVRSHARSLVPNLSAVVGERTAARLVSAAGGVAALSRMRAGRIQLLGTRRRPSPERGPRYGLLYRAARMEEVPPGRRGAYARSLGAIAAIAIRADATTHSAIGAGLVARRDRRIAQLRRSA